MMKKAKKWIFDEYGIEFPKGDSIPGDWFQKHNLPMIVECAECGTTMALPSAYINREGYTFCPSCAGY